MPTQYYIGYPTSEELAQVTRRVEENRQAGGAEPYAPMMNKFVALMLPELLKTLLVDTANNIQVDSRKLKIVNSSVATINKAIVFMCDKLIGNRSNRELSSMARYVDDTFLPADVSSKGKDCIGCVIDPELYQRMRQLEDVVKNGKTDKKFHKDLDKLLADTVDAVVDGFLTNPLSHFKLSFILRKVKDGAIATCKSAGHLVIRKVFSNLSQDQLLKLTQELERLVVTVEK